MQLKLTKRDFSKLALSIGSASLLPLGTVEALAQGKQTLKYGSNKLDWYPARTNNSAAPTLIFVHGGAWSLGNRRQVGAKARHFTQAGYNFASVSYTLFPAANIQTQALQIGEAVNFVHANARQLNADPNRIALMGHSAGCHLSSLATLTGAALPVKALICNDTRAYDVPFLANINGGRLPSLYASPFRLQKNWAAWSPISYTGLQQQPPTLVSWSSGHNRDMVSKHFADALEFDGAEVHRFDGSKLYNHLSINRRMGRERGKLTNTVETFLDDVLSRTV